jgi:hypothetical protein
MTILIFNLLSSAYILFFYLADEHFGFMVVNIFIAIFSLEFMMRWSSDIANN